MLIASALLHWPLPIGCSSEPAPPLPVELRGCDHLGVGPTCHRPADRKVRFWVPTAAAPEVLLDDRPLPSTARATQGGHHVTVALTGHGSLEIRAPEGTARIALTEWTRAPEVDQALAGEIDDDALDGLPAASRVQAAWAMATRGIGTTTLQDVEQIATKAEIWDWGARAAAQQAYVHVASARRTAEALQALARAQQHLQHMGNVVPYRETYAVDYYLGRAHQTGGDHRRALAAFARAERRAERLGRADHVSSTQAFVAESLLRGGQVDEALVTFERQVAELASAQAPDPCKHAGALNAHAWGILLATEAGFEVAAEAAPPLEQALQLLRGATCDVERQQPQFLAHAHLNRALAAIQHDESDTAAEHLRLASEAAPDLDEPWALEIAGRVALATADPSTALERFMELEARVPDQLELRWMALRGQAQALQALGRTDAAIDRYLQAQRLFFQQGLLVPVHLGRADFLAQRQAATASLADLLVRQGRSEQAFAAFRDFRAQYLLGLQQTSRLFQGQQTPPGWVEALDAFREAQEGLLALPDDADLPADEVSANQARRQALRRDLEAAVDRGNAALGAGSGADRRDPEPGELLLGWIRTTEGWIGFAQTDQSTRSTRFGAEVDTPDALLAAFADAIEEASQVTLFVWGPTQHMDFHAATVGTAPLIAKAAVRYAVDTPAAQSAPTSFTSALVVTDPTRDLPKARVEGQEVRTALQDRAAQVAEASGFAATRRHVLEQLPEHGWFHFSGHGRSEAGWGAALQLADGDLRVADVLALRASPAVVVLNACEASGKESEGAVAMAEAFVSAGASAVVAPSRPVSESLAQQLSEELYAAAASEDLDVADAYRKAIVAVSKASPEADWASYRLLVP